MWVEVDIGEGNVESGFVRPFKGKAFKVKLRLMSSILRCLCFRGTE